MPFIKGQSGNPKGRKPGTGRPIKDIQVLAREHAALCIDSLRKIAEDGDTDAAKVAAIKLLLAYGYGQPPESVKVSGDSEAPLQVNIKWENDWRGGAGEA